MLLRRRGSVNKDSEKNILKCMITSTKFLDGIRSEFKKDYFDTDFAKIISEWCINYYDKYGKSIQGNIKNYYELYKDKLKEETSDIVNTFLRQLSKEYEVREESYDSNLKFYIDESFKYFKKREIELIAQKSLALIQQGKSDEAQDMLLSFKEPSPIKMLSTPIVSKESFEKARLQTKEDTIFEYNGRLKELVGPMRRGWIVGFIAPSKRGKSFHLLELAHQACFQKRKVLFFSFENSETETTNRAKQNLSGYPIEEADTFKIPIMDCFKNQTGICKNRKRANKIKLVENIRDFPPLEKKGYRVCTECRDKSSEFQPIPYWYLDYRDIINEEIEKKALKRFNYRGGTAENLKQYSVDSDKDSDFVDLNSIKMALKREREINDFVPDIIILDYIDLIQKRKGSTQESREQANESWIQLKGIARKNKCLIVTATQANRAGFDKAYIDNVNLSEDIRKSSHCDIMMALNQLPQEKERMYMRLSVIDHRHRHFNPNRSVMMLNNLGIGKPIMDSEWFDNEILSIYKKNTK